MPREINNNYLTAPTPNLDLLTLIYKLRYSGGSGAFTFVENDKTYTVTFQQGIAERVKTDAGEFDTVVVSVQSDFVTDMGLKGPPDQSDDRRRKTAGACPFSDVKRRIQSTARKCSTHRTRSRSATLAYTGTGSHAATRNDAAAESDADALHRQSAARAGTGFRIR